MSVLGNIVRQNKKEAAAAAGITTADNGLTANTATNVRLGGTLLVNTSIQAAAFGLTIFKSSIVSNATALTVNAFAAGAGATGILVFGDTGITISSNTHPLILTRTNGTANSVQRVALFAKSSSPTAGAAGIGLSIEYALTNSIGSNNTMGVQSFIYTDPTDLALRSQYKLTLAHNATMLDVLSIASTGAARLNQYGIGTFAGVAAYTLQVDASGNIIEGAAAGAGWGTTGTVATLTGNAVLALAGNKFGMNNGADEFFFIDIPNSKSYFAAGDVGAFATSVSEFVLNQTNSGLAIINTQDATGLLVATLNVDPTTEQVLIQATNGIATQRDTTMIHTLTAWANGAGAALGTLTNAPAAGDPTKWIPVDDNGTTRHIPAW